MINAYFIIVIFLVGVLIILNGIYHLPNGRLEIKANKMFVTGHQNAFDLLMVKQVEIHHNRILIYDINDKLIRVDNLDIDKIWAQKIIDYLFASIGHIKIKVVNKVLPAL
ncbi:hypothetical protein [Mucilaginibacter lacusdianchii]|uniref:hypothetical protein n=1 Tax=Mucilaginibacter lacusdianchii TaxID=2684211 RepID=UPI00131B1398|nr:hypothetical protein [Mucilaginibacter sp. JXJ CY 39]